MASSAASHQGLVGVSFMGSVAEKGGMTVRQANWCQCSRWESGRRKKASHHLHPESWAVIREADGLSVDRGRVRAGRLSTEKAESSGCRGSCHGRRQYPTHRYGEGGSESRGVEEPRHVRTHCIGTWEVSMPSRSRSGTAEGRRNPKPMMNGMEKSDSVVIAVKSANKGTAVPAESMERRTEPEGNPGSQSTRRAQDRESVTQAADWIRRFVQRFAVSSTQGRSLVP